MTAYSPLLDGPLWGFALLAGVLVLLVAGGLAASAADRRDRDRHRQQERRRRAVELDLWEPPR